MITRLWKTVPVAAAIMGTAGFVVMAIASAGCTTGQTVMAHHTRATFVTPGPSSPATGFIAGILPMGSIAYDNRSLPLVSPDGSFVATQVGGPPEWSTLLAATGCPLPDDSRIEIYRLDRRLGEAELTWVTEAGLLLGRGGDERGFLVEKPQPDGARWIGSMSWSGGRTTWMVTGNDVNAFASLGPGKRLAWSRRAGGAEHFDLVIRHGGEQWTVGGEGADWLMPVWSGTNLFALRLHDGRLDAVFMNAATPDTTRETELRMVIATGRTRYDAWQCLAGHAGNSRTAGTTNDRTEPHLLLWHPGATRMAMWLPWSSPAAPMLLAPQSIAAVVDPSGNVLVTTPDGIRLQNPADPERSRTLIPGTHVLRPVMDDAWPYLVLTPESDRIGVMAMRLLPYK